MSCVPYNIVKEGYLSNLTTATVIKLTDEQVLALYDNDALTPAVTVVGTGLVGLLAEFGESYDVCYVDYHTDEVVASNISIKYGTTSGTENIAPLVLHSAGIYRATVSGIVNFIDIRHSLTAGSTDINQLEIIAAKNETLGFGTSVFAQTDYAALEHATAGTKSATANIIPLFNNNTSEQTVRVAIAPTFTPVDDYLYLATAEEGPYYGINDYCFQQPGLDPLLLVDDSMISSESIHPQWERRLGGRSNAVIPTAEGVIIDTAAGTGYTNASCCGLLSKEYFTPHSFVIDVDVRFLGSYTPFNDEARGFYLAITNDHFIHGIGNEGRVPTDDRLGWSTVGIGISPHRFEGTFNTKDAWNTDFVYKDGSPSSYPLTGGTERASTHWARQNNFYAGGGLDMAYGGSNIGPDFSGFEDILNVGQPMNDFTENSVWHTWRLVYDHIKQEVSGYVDKVFLGSYTMKVDSFTSGTKLWIGSQGANGWKVALKNFKVHHNKVYRQKDVALATNGGVATATISGVSSNTQYLNNGSPSPEYIGPHPTSLAKIRVDFDKEYDIVGYRLEQRNPYDAPYPDRFGVEDWHTDVVVTSIVDYGGVRSYTNVYPPVVSQFSDTPRAADKRSPTFSGTATTISGVSYMEWQLVDFDRTPSANNALIIEELNVYAEEWSDVSPQEGDLDKIRWFEGRWKNLRQVGETLILNSTGYSEYSMTVAPEYLQLNVDYGFSSAKYKTTQYLYDFAEALFRYRRTDDNAGSEAIGWYSDTQSASEPFYIWRHFPELVGVSVIQLNTFRFTNQVMPKEFKLQYLIERGDPNREGDWADIPPISIPHTDTSTSANLRYGRYKQYKIDNNDGEYYTNNHLQVKALTSDPGGIGFFGVGTTSERVLSNKVPTGYADLDGPTPVYNGDTSISRMGPILLIELDEVVLTRGIRVVIKNPVVDVSTLSNVFRVTVSEFLVWGTSAVGSYTSPVFDTGTKQNTERVLVEAEVPPNTHVDVYVRSWDIPPAQSYNLGYEVWEPRGNFGQPGFAVVVPDSRGRAISIGNETHFLHASPYVYNHTLGTWSQPYGGYPAQQAGGPSAGDMFDTADLGSGVTATIRPDPSVDDRAALVDNVIYVAADETANTGSDRLMYLNLNDSNPRWTVFGNQRPPATTDATMCAYEKRLYFFNQSGPVYYWDIETFNWVAIGAVVPTFGGTRSRMTSVLYSGKIYLFGANNTDDTPISHEVSIFDPVKESFTSGTNSPIAMRQVQPIVVGNVIYVLARNTLDANHRYYPDEDRWEVFSSLKWSRDYSAENNVTADYYFLHDDYIYKVDASQGIWRTYVAKDQWTHGKFPDPRDLVWGTANSLAITPWKKVSSFGELTPQERYFQFKVEMHSDNRVNTPALQKVKVVVPQTISVPALGTSDIYLKVDASEKGTFNLWYAARKRYATGADFYNDWSILYTSSDAPSGWSYPLVASGTYVNPLNSNQAFSARSPWVVPDGTGGYDCWYADVLDSSLSASNPLILTAAPSIYYINTNDPGNLSSINLKQEAVSASAVPESDGGVWHPTVVVSGTDNLHRMWFTMVDRSVLSGGSITQSTTQRIGYAESSNKYTWTNQQVVVDAGEDAVHGYDSTASYRPCVIFDNGLYRMWYTGVDASSYGRILYRESVDGIVWGEIQLHVDLGAFGFHDQWGASSPHVVKDASLYYLFYFGYDGKDKIIIRAESPGGFDWSNFTVVFPGYGVQGTADSEGVDDFFVLIEKEPAQVGTSLTTGRLKIHNEDTGI